MLRGYVITSVRETQRAAFVKELMEQLPGIQQATAVYPTQEHVPFLNRLKENAHTRFFRPFLDGEIGILLSNRRIWKEIVRTKGPGSCKNSLDSPSRGLFHPEFDSCILTTRCAGPVL